jgi:histidinol phosphatase-like PHP family hydrolase
MAPKTDFHIHTELSACAARDMTLAAVIEGVEAAGVAAIGIADHLNAREHAERNALVRKEIEQLDTPVEVYLGAEVGFAYKLGRHPLTGEDKARLGYQFAVGSHHSTYLKEYDLDRIVRRQHEYHLATCADPVIDVLGHPWRFLYESFQRAGWPWIDTMKCVPESMTRELARAAIESGTAIEINTTSNLCMKFQPESYFEEYVDYVAILAEEGVTFSLGSDAHELHEFETIHLAWEVVDRLQIGDERIWRPIGPPANRPREKDA